MTIPVPIVAAIEIGDEIPVALYRLYSAEGKLLYVGITQDLKGRLASHEESKEWWPLVVRKTVEWHLSRAAAAAAELKAIRSERPAYNIRGFGIPVLRSVSGEDIYALVKMEMPPTSLRLALLERAGMTTSDALEALGVGRTHSYRVINGRKHLPKRGKRVV